MFVMFQNFLNTLQPVIEVDEEVSALVNSECNLSKHETDHVAPEVGTETFTNEPLSPLLDDTETEYEDEKSPEKDTAPAEERSDCWMEKKDNDLVAKQGDAPAETDADSAEKEDVDMETREESIELSFTSSMAETDEGFLGFPKHSTPKTCPQQDLVKKRSLDGDSKSSQNAICKVNKEVSTSSTNNEDIAGRAFPEALESGKCVKKNKKIKVKSNEKVGGQDQVVLRQTTDEVHNTHASAPDGTSEIIQVPDEDDEGEIEFKDYIGTILEIRVSNLLVLHNTAHFFYFQVKPFLGKAKVPK